MGIIMEAGIRLGRNSQLLSPSAKWRVERATLQFLRRARFLRDPRSWRQAAVDALRPSFRAASAQAMDVLASYLLGRVAVAIAKIRPPGGHLINLGAIELELQGELDSMSELGETQSRLQMAMDSMSKMMTTLSNIMKKSSDTSESVVRHIK